MPGKWVKVRYFAVLRERCGKTEERLEVAPEARAGDVLDAVVERHPSIGPLRGQLRLAINQELCSPDSQVHEDDEVALIPPVAGGCDFVSLQDDPLSIDQVVAAVSRPEAGGVCVFVGTVRNHNDGKTVAALDYEAYAEMALRDMSRIIEELERENPGVRLAIAHRLGRLRVGDFAVVIAASASHRAEAFSACKAMIDRVKERVPIWKREYGPDGETHWVGL